MCITWSVYNFNREDADCVKRILRRGEEDDYPGRYLQHNPEKTSNKSIHLKVE